MTVDSQNGVRDLLHRFVAAPFVFSAPGVRIETNDPQILADLRTSRFHDDWRAKGGISVRLIRDSGVPHGNGRATFLLAGAARAIAMGNGTMVLVDAERREILGFISEDIKPGQVVFDLISIACELLADEPSKIVAAQFDTE